MTQPRMTQIMGIEVHAPDTQEAILFLPRVEVGKDPVAAAEVGIRRSH